MDNISDSARCRIISLLEDVLVLHDLGPVVYVPGWGDARVAEKIAKETGEPVEASHVATLRLPLFEGNE